MKVAICKLNDEAKIPTRGSEWAAGYDLYACLPERYVTIEPGETKKIGTGISIALPHDYCGQVFARSGLATKFGLRPANCVGIIDADYRGEIIVAMHNDSNEEYMIKDGERIAQLVITPCLSVGFKEYKTLDNTNRGDGGFGSTGAM